MTRRASAWWVVAAAFTVVNLALVALAATHEHRHWHQLAVHGGLLLIGVAWMWWLRSRRFAS
jgi:hypothetical protein